MEDSRVKIKYHEGYDPKVDEELTAIAVVLGGEFSDRALEEGAREISFEFENDKDLRKFFRIWKGLLAEREEDQDKGGEDANSGKIAQCNEAINEIMPLVDRFRNEGRHGRVLVEAMLRLENRRVKLGLIHALRASRTPRIGGTPPERNNRVGTQYGDDFRRLLSQKALGDEGFQLGLKDGDKMARLLEPMIIGPLAIFDLSSAPPDLRPGLQRTAEHLVSFGLRTHCICFRSPYRFRHDGIVSLKELYDDWNIKSLTAFSRLRGYNEHNRGIPRLVCDAVLDNEVEPIQKQLGLGWWRRMRNHAKFASLFWEGILLGVMYDMKSKELADQKAGQSTVAQLSTPNQMPDLRDEDIPF